MLAATLDHRRPAGLLLVVPALDPGPAPPLVAVADVVTVAIPVRDGGPLLDEVLAAVRAQQVDAEVELLVCDSGSTRRLGGSWPGGTAPRSSRSPRRFSHGGTRNDLMAPGRGQPRRVPDPGRHAGRRALARAPARRLRARRRRRAHATAPTARAATRPRRCARELSEWFAAMAPNGGPATVRLEHAERPVARSLIPQARMFFSDANGCIARAAWEEVPFRDVAYAEDRLLAAELLAAGYAKVYVPDAAVVHSHRLPARAAPAPLLRRVARRCARSTATWSRSRSSRRRSSAVRRGRPVLAAPPRDPRHGRVPRARGRPGCRPACAGGSRSRARA